MKLRAQLFLLTVIILSACAKDIPASQKIVVPEFIDVKYDFGTFLENRYAVLSASLSAGGYNHNCQQYYLYPEFHLFRG